MALGLGKNEREVCMGRKGGRGVAARPSSPSLPQILSGLLLGSGGCRCALRCVLGHLLQGCMFVGDGGRKFLGGLNNLNSNSYDVALSGRMASCVRMVPNQFSD